MTASPTPTVQGVTAEEVEQDDRFAREFREAARVAGVHGSMEPYARVLSSRLRQMDKRAKAANKAISELREQTKLDVGLARAATEAAKQRAEAALARATQTAESNERLREVARPFAKGYWTYQDSTQAVWCYPNWSEHDRRMLCTVGDIQRAAALFSDPDGDGAHTPPSEGGREVGT